MSPILILIAAFVGVAALVGGVAMLFRGDGDSDMEDRLRQFTTKQPAKGSQGSVLKGGASASALGMATPMEEFFSKFSFNRLFEQADTSLTPVKFLGFSAILGVAGAAAGLFAGLSPLLMPLLAIFAGMFPLLWLLFRKKRRMKKFAGQLPDALELMARALRAGHSLAAGLKLVSDEMSAPISQEFMRVYDEQNLGIPLEEALDMMTERVPNLDLRFFVTAVILQRQTGGDLAEILDKIGSLIRERFKIWGQVQALTGEGRLSGIVLLALPPVLFIAVWRLNPEYVMVLFTDPMGKQMLIVAAVMQLIGALVIRKIVNIKV
ncbi:MAG: type II secretion system F family protein [Pirellulales bacterium]